MPTLDPTVSVVIPCFRQAEFLAEAVESVIAQTFEDWEVVIVDDGSPDDTEAVALRLIREYGDRIRLLQQPNAGVPIARNAGIAASRGRYILPLDADDQLHPDMLTETVKLLERDLDIAIAYTDFQLFGSDDRVVRVPEFNLDGLCRGNRFIATSLYRREAWEAAGGYKANMKSGYEDWDFWLGCAERGYLPRRVPRVLFRYRSRPGTRDDMSRATRRAMRDQVIKNHPALYTPWLRARRRIRRAPTNLQRHIGRFVDRIRGNRGGARPEPW